MWGHVNKTGCAEKCQTNHLRERITATIRSVTADILQREWTETEHRLKTAAQQTESTLMLTNKNI
jgi:hypothetical protein